MSKFLIPVILVFGIYILLNGHLSPGGGFSGGAILAAGLMLFAMVWGDAAASAVLTVNFASSASAALIRALISLCVLFSSAIASFSALIAASSAVVSSPVIFARAASSASSAAFAASLSTAGVP